MSKVHKLLNQKGISLIQVMIAGAMMVGISVVGMRIMENQSKMTKGVQQSSEATSFYSLVSSLMSGKDACTETFRGILNNVPAMDPNKQNPLAYNNPIRDSKGVAIFTPGNTYGVVNFVGMEIFNTTFDTTQLATNSSGILEVRLNFTRESDPNVKRTTVGTNEFSRSLMIFVNLDPNPDPAIYGTFIDCYDISDSIVDTVFNSICADLGGSPDPVTRICDPTTIFQDPENLKDMCEGLEFTWDEVEGKCNKYTRGGHYGGCSKELLVDTTFKGTYNQVWPVLNCSTNPPTCDAGFKAVQLAGGLVNVTPFGDLRAEMSTIWETWTCAKE